MLGAWVFLLLISHLGSAQTTCNTPDPDPVSASTLWGSPDCTNPMLYFPPPNDPNFPVRRIRCVLHIIRKSDGTGNFDLINNPAHKAFLYDDTPNSTQNTIWKVINERLRAVGNYSKEPGVINRAGYDPYTCESNPPPLSDRKDSYIQYVLSRVVHHDNDATYNSFNVINQSSGLLAQAQLAYINNYVKPSTDLTFRDSSLHIVLANTCGIIGQEICMANDGIEYSSKNIIGQAVAGNSVYVMNAFQWYLLAANQVEKDDVHWWTSNSLSHELGHLLSLDHTFVAPNAVSIEEDVDGCWDTPTDRQGCTSNLMDYWPQAAYYLSPQQMARMRLSATPGLEYAYQIDKTVIRDWCNVSAKPYNSVTNPTPTQAYIIPENTTVEWNTAQFWDRNIHLKRGAKLIIRCLVHMPANAKIVLMDRAQLIIDGGKITTTCPGVLWQGIEMIYSTNNIPQAAQASCEVINGGTIENARFGILAGYYVAHSNQLIETPGIGGGVIKVDGGNFKNNMYSIYFSNYSKWPSQSYIKNANFICDRPLNLKGNTSGTLAHIRIGNIGSIPIENCSFTQTYGSFTSGLFATGNAAIRIEDGIAEIRNCKFNGGSLNAGHLGTGVLISQSGLNSRDFPIVVEDNEFSSITANAILAIGSFDGLTYRSDLTIRNNTINATPLPEGNGRATRTGISIFGFTGTAIHNNLISGAIVGIGAINNVYGD